MAYKNEQIKVFNPCVENSSLVGSEQTEKVRRLYLEALDIASFLCKTHLKYYGFSKIFDIIIQIIPTAFIYNTSYWVFYAVNGKCICICERYKIACRHVQGKNHWVDMNPVEEKVNESFPAKFTNPVICSTPVIEIKPLSVNDMYFFDVKCEVHVKNDIGEKMPYCLPHIYVEDCRIFTLGARLELIHEFAPAEIATIIFDPHPQLLSFYGSYFTELQRSKIMRVLQMTEENIPLTQIHMTPVAPRYTLYVSSSHFKFESPLMSQENFRLLNEATNKYTLICVRRDDNPSSSDADENFLFDSYSRDNAINEGVEGSNDKKILVESFKKLNIKNN